MHVMKSSKQLTHICLGHIFTEHLVFLLGNLLKELTSSDVLHNEVNVLLVNIGFIILYDIWVIKFGEDSNFFLNGIKMIFKLVFIQNFDGYLMVGVDFVMS